MMTMTRVLFAGMLGLSACGADAAYNTPQPPQDVAPEAPGPVVLPTPSETPSAELCASREHADDSVWPAGPVHWEHPWLDMGKLTMGTASQEIAVRLRNDGPVAVRLGDLTVPGTAHWRVVSTWPWDGMLRPGETMRHVITYAPSSLGRTDAQVVQVVDGKPVVLPLYGCAVPNGA